MRLRFNPQDTTWYFIHEILRQARSIEQEELAAKQIVGAQLSIAFPYGNYSVTSHSDTEPDRRGDFQVDNTVFFVSADPPLAFYESCRACVKQGFDVYLLVPAQRIIGCRQLVESVAPRRITVLSVEDFVSLSIDLRAIGSIEEIIAGCRRLLEVYNQRVGFMRSEEFMLIEVPEALLN